MNAFAAALRSLLDEHGLSQAALARQLGITPQAVSSWANGDNVPSHANVTQAEEILNVRPRGSLVQLAGYAARQPVGDHTVESLLRADPGIDPEDKRALLRLLSLARDRFASRDLPPAVRLEGELRGLRDDLQDRDRQRR